jgi:exosortase C (VPDSG-CTERM-specific)
MSSQVPLKEPRSVEVAGASAAASAPGRLRQIAGWTYAGLLIFVFGPTLIALAIHVTKSDLHSYVPLIPFISGYLLYSRRGQLPRDYSSSPGWGSIAAFAGFAALAVAFIPDTAIQPLSKNDYLSLMTLSFLCFLAAGGFICFGRKWMAAAAFPIGFLIFMIPMPDVMAHTLETASQLASVEVADVFFTASRTPFLREGTIFQLPNIVIQVAQECSGIRSSWILFITSLLASDVLLRTPWRRAVLVAFVIPLGILRNGFRILVIGLLCVHVGPEMINSFIHRKGGPFFFVLSLFPLFLILIWLRAREAAEPSPRKRNR